MTISLLENLEAGEKVVVILNTNMEYLLNNELLLYFRFKKLFILRKKLTLIYAYSILNITNK